MRARAHGVTVTVASGRSIEYPWATGLKIDKYWDLHIFHGRRQRVYHPAGEWVNVRCTSAVLPDPPAMGFMPAINVQDAPTETWVRPSLQLDRQFTRTVRQVAEQEAR